MAALEAGAGLRHPRGSLEPRTHARITHETANSAYLCDARRLDGYWYLFYAGSTELQTFDGRGHAKIGVARSKDLERRKVPPKPKQPLGTG